MTHEDKTPPSGSTLFRGLSEMTGRLVIKNAVKLAAVLSALLVWVWDMRGDFDERVQAIRDNTAAVVQLQKDVDELKDELRRVDKKLWRLGVRRLPIIGPILPKTAPEDP